MNIADPNLQKAPAKVLPVPCKILPEFLEMPLLTYLRIM